MSSGFKRRTQQRVQRTADTSRRLVRHRQLVPPPIARAERQQHLVRHPQHPVACTERTPSNPSGNNPARPPANPAPAISTPRRFAESRNLNSRLRVSNFAPHVPRAGQQQFAQARRQLRFPRLAEDARQPANTCKTGPPSPRKPSAHSGVPSSPSVAARKSSDKSFTYGFAFFSPSGQTSSTAITIPLFQRRKLRRKPRRRRVRQWCRRVTRGRLDFILLSPTPSACRIARHSLGDPSSLHFRP